MERRFNNADYHAQMLPLRDYAKTKQQKKFDEETQAEIDICLNCTRKHCNGGDSCRIQDKRREWTQEEKDYLINNRGKMSVSDIAIALSKSKTAVKEQMRRLTKGETK